MILDQSHTISSYWVAGTIENGTPQFLRDHHGHTLTFPVVGSVDCAKAVRTATAAQELIDSYVNLPGVWYPMLIETTAKWGAR